MKTNNEILLELIDKHKLKHKKIASVLLISISTVKAYTCNAASSRYRNFPDRNLIMLNRYLTKHSISRQPTASI